MSEWICPLCKLPESQHDQKVEEERKTANEARLARGERGIPKIPDSPDTRREKFYVASRASIPARSEMWRNLRAKGMDIVSSWIDEAGEGETESFGELWLRIQREVQSADALLLYIEPGDFPLKGALVEVGMALAMGKPVKIYAPGVTLEQRTFKPVGSWSQHPLVTFVNSPFDFLCSTTRSPDTRHAQAQPPSLALIAQRLVDLETKWQGSATWTTEDAAEWQNAINDLKTAARPAEQPAFRDFGPMSCCICGDPTITRKFLPSEEMIALHVCRTEQPAPSQEEVAYERADSLDGVAEIMDKYHATAQPSAPPQPACFTEELARTPLEPNADAEKKSGNPYIRPFRAAEPSVEHLVEMVFWDADKAKKDINAALAAAKREGMESAGRGFDLDVLIEHAERVDQLWATSIACILKRIKAASKEQP